MSQRHRLVDEVEFEIRVETEVEVGDNVGKSLCGFVGEWAMVQSRENKGRGKRRCTAEGETLTVISETAEIAHVAVIDI